jgi:AraC-like DNA-binding protein
LTHKGGVYSIHAMDTGTLCEPIVLDPASSVHVERVVRPACAPAPEPFAHFHEPAELIWFTAAHGTVMTDHGTFPIDNGTLLFLPAMAIHDFRLDPGATDWVLVHCDSALGGADPALAPDRLALPQCHVPSLADRARIEAAFEWLVGLSTRPGRAGDVVALTRLILKELPGAEPVAGSEATGRSLHRLRPALDLVAGSDFRLVTIEEAAARCNLSPAYFSRTFARVFGTGFADYARQYRLRAAARSLTAEGARISDIAYRSGFQTPSHFAAAFRKRFGMSPNAFRRRYLGSR